jgi:DNA-directed RNA polymerase specialized sigma24 family protein
MLSEPQRQTIIERHAKGLSLHQISHTLGHSRRTVRRAQRDPRAAGR